ncbi:MAG TPA: tail fiber protein [Longimicrobiales bacterium]|nr:tail fiber protein [Longimicrobiales bacterium]
MADGAINQDSDRPFIAEFRLFAFGFVPAGWHACDGQQLSIPGHQPLFSLIGWRFGGDGWTTFGLPEMTIESEPDVVVAIAVDGVLADRGGDDD